MDVIDCTAIVPRCKVAKKADSFASKFFVAWQKWQSWLPKCSANPLFFIYKTTFLFYSPSAEILEIQALATEVQHTILFPEKINFIDTLN